MTNNSYVAGLVLVLTLALFLPATTAQQDTHEAPTPSIIDRIVETITVTIPRLVINTALFISGPDTVQVGETFTVDANSLNYDDNPDRSSSDPCYGSGIDTDVAPFFFYDTDTIDKVSTSGWEYTGGMAGYTFEADFEAQASGTVDIDAQYTCLDGTKDTETHTVDIEQQDDGGDTGDTTSPDISVSSSANTITLGQAVSYDASAWDSESGMNSIVISGDTSDFASCVGSSCTLEGTVEPDSTGTFTITATAEDAAGNEAQDTTTVTVEEERDPEASITVTLFETLLALLGAG